MSIWSSFNHGDVSALNSETFRQRAGVFRSFITSLFRSRKTFVFGTRPVCGLWGLVCIGYCCIVWQMFRRLIWIELIYTSCCVWKGSFVFSLFFLLLFDIYLSVLFCDEKGRKITYKYIPNSLTIGALLISLIFAN